MFTFMMGYVKRFVCVLDRGGDRMLDLLKLVIITIIDIASERLKKPKK